MMLVFLFCATVLYSFAAASESSQAESVYKMLWLSQKNIGKQQQYECIKEIIADVPETSEELIQDFVTVVRLLDDVAKTYEQKNDTNQSNEVVYPMLTLAKYVTQQVDDTAPEVKEFLNKALGLKAGKDIHDKETKEEAEEMRKLISGLDQNARKEVKKLREVYEAKADKLGLEDLLLSIKDEE